MKTLKKTLCLVLAVVMVVGVLVLPANAAATTTEDTEATAAFNTLLGYGVMYGVDANNKPALDKNINRQDMAAIVYRIMTGDTKNQYVANYVGSAEKFADSATFATWAKGYIGYVRNNGIFMGDEKGNFKPTDNITGDEVLTVLLRCIGYGKNNEFTGASWAENAETQATQIHLFGNATGYKDVKDDMSKVINRGVVAKLTFNAVKAPMVTYYNGAYSDSTVDGRPVAPNAGGDTNPSLISTGDNSDKVEVKYDEWGTPSKDVEQYVYFNYPQTKVTSTKKIPLEPMTTFWTAKSHCDLCAELKVETAISADITVYTNGYENKTTLAKLDPLNTQAQIGAQGRYTAVYDTTGNGKPDTIVYKDTLLAEVSKVSEATFDAAGHLRTEATLTLRVYDGPAATPAITTSSADGTGVTVAELKNGSTNWTYSKGDMLLVFYHQTSKDNTDAQKTYTADNNKDDKVDWKDYYTIQSVATSITGPQTVVSYSDDAHTISGTKILDNNRYVLDEAGSTMNTNFTWYLDSKGNVIGSTTIKAATNFGVITSIYWKDNGDGTGSAIATVTYVDGTTATLEVGNVTAVGSGDHTEINADTMYATGVAVNADTGSAAMSFDQTSVNAGSSKLYVSTTANLNEDNDIVDGHLFKITAATSGKYNFVEVAGNGTASGNYAQFSGLANTENTQTITKGQATNGSVKIDDNTVFLVRSGSAPNYTYTSVKGFNNIIDYAGGEVDYVETNDGDTAAEYVYITAAPVAAKGWHIFFADSNKVGDAPQLRYDDNGTTYTVYGYLDGVAGSVTIRKEKVNGTNTTDDPIVADFINAKNGNTMWLVKLDGGYVVDVNGEEANTANQNLAVNGSTPTNGSFASHQANTAYTGAGAALKGTGTTTGAMSNVDAELGVYKDLSLVMELNITSAKTIDGNVLAVGSTVTDLNIASAKVVVGDLNMLKAASNDYKVNVIAIYKANGKAATELYIWHNDEGTGTASGGSSAPVAADINFYVTIDGVKHMVSKDTGWHAYAAWKDAVDNAATLSLSGELKNQASSSIGVEEIRDSLDDTDDYSVVIVNPKPANTADPTSAPSGSGSAATASLKVGDCIAIQVKAKSGGTAYWLAIVITA